MNQPSEAPKNVVFSVLLPDGILEAAEDALGIRCTNICRPLNSYINRVYELQQEDGTGLIIKFYRPGRWSTAALQEEHDFLLELMALEIPVVGPLTFENGKTLGEFHGIPFTVFPRKSGRSFDEFSDDQWLELGHLMGRLHAAGASRSAPARAVISPAVSTRQQVDYILASRLLPDDLAATYLSVTSELISEIEPGFRDIENLRLHGDCHFSNIIHRPDESFYLIDFDDMANGPAVQDFWMLLPGYLRDSRAEIELFLEGYEVFRDFDRRTLGLIEPLRAMRYIHYSAWCVHQVVEDGLTRVADSFGSREYWQDEIRDLVEQLERIKVQSIGAEGFLQGA